MNNSYSGISFGSACIDALLNPRELVYQVGQGKPVVACIAGPDGVGKSILGLTAASTYAASVTPKNCRVIYASTDLNIDQATTTWASFGLDLPNERRKIIRQNLEELYFDSDDCTKLRVRDKKLSHTCKLTWLSPFPAEEDAFDNSEQGENANTIPVSTKQGIGKRGARHVLGGKSDAMPEPYGKLYENCDEARVYFLDLAAYSAGDDWGLINHMVGLLRCKFEENGSPHLLIVDAVEGLETMAGSYDRFGLQRSRRSRLAQLVRLARKSNCSLMFIIEQKSSDVHLDEVFVSDLVLRLRTQQYDEYLQKTIEVEKARSVSHIRGVHELQIRDGRGGNAESDNPDDPRMNLGNKRCLGYLQVIPSLHQKAKAAGLTQSLRPKLSSR